VNKNLRLLFIFFFFTLIGLAQKKKNNTSKEKDSITSNFKKGGVVFSDSTVLKKRKVINPLAPSKAAFYSAVIPGLGQVYNKRYWKAPIAIGLIGAGIYGYKYNNALYNRFRTAFKSRQIGFTNDEFYDLNGDNLAGSEPDFGIDDLESQQERYQRDRDLMLVLVIVAYAINIIDANVDAHLKQYNIDSDLSLDFKPYLEYNPITANPNYGMALTIKF